MFLGMDPAGSYGYTIREGAGGRIALDPVTRLLRVVQFSSLLVLGDMVIQPKTKVFYAGDLRINAHPGLVAIATLLAREHNGYAYNLTLGDSSLDDETYLFFRVIFFPLW
jgi:hypothetical protein